MPSPVAPFSSSRDAERCVSPRDDFSERVHRRANVGSEVAWLLLADPALEADLEGCHAGFGGETRGGLRDAARTERLRNRHGERRELDELAFLNLGVLGDEAVARAHV